MASWADAAASSKTQSGTKQLRASSKDDEQPEVIEIGKSDFTVDSEDGEVITLTLMDQEYALDLETAAELAEQLVDANPSLEKTD